MEAAAREDWPRTVEEFDAWHARQPERWEFLWGYVRMMAPASMNHCTFAECQPCASPILPNV